MEIQWQGSHFNENFPLLSALLLLISRGLFPGSCLRCNGLINTGLQADVGGAKDFNLFLQENRSINKNNPRVYYDIVISE